ncbi:TetR/AcrR family transcriptional regulator [Glaciihabitans sp. dw_435]|uniref:TetR/AcrR family transcriptional regulator n=1 Tax=Glaciihabitans sp. dw_435 TaxID=2720081 RepID=UPI001BD4864D|nr:TetR/AcrR family transcriptional regulator [Glaciihabitans sp. dw_435]
MNDVTPTKVSEPRERLLATAADLFYRDGIHSVGVDRIVAAANVTRATFYRHFPGKEDLVNAYLNLEDATIRGFFANIPEGATPEQILEGIIEGIANDITYNHTRGCPFINAAAEYPDATSEVRKTVTRHREWFRQSLQSALEAAGRDDAAGRARTLVLLRDAALVGGYLDGVDTIRDTFMTAARATAALPA